MSTDNANVNKKAQTSQSEVVSARRLARDWRSFALLWLLAAAWYEGGWQRAVWALIITAVIAGATGKLAGVKSLVMTRPLELLAALLAFAMYGWLYATGSYHSWSRAGWDVAGLVTGIVVGALLFELVGRVLRSAVPGTLRPTGATRDAIRSIVILSTGWISVTVFTLVRTPLLPADPGRFSELASKPALVPPLASRWSDVQVGLALSGGGYRAAVFHCGTIHALETLGLRTRTLSTVSGGSIIGAYYSIGGDPVIFKDAVAAGRFNLERELLLAHNAVRLLFPFNIPGINVELFPFYRFDRLNAQAEMLNRLLYSNRSSWRAPGSNQPNLVVGTTDLIYGLNVGLLPDGLMTLDSAHHAHVYRGKSYESNDLATLPLRVAISGAFPLAFPSYRFSFQISQDSEGVSGTRILSLADGGLADNMGIDLLEAANRLACHESRCTQANAPGNYALDQRWTSEVMLVSDGGAVFDVAEQLATPVGEVARAIDVSGARGDSASTDVDSRRTPVVYFSARENYVDPGTQFRMKSASTIQPSSTWQVAFDPRDGTPDAVLRALVALLPAAIRSDSEQTLERYFRERRDGVDLAEWRQLLPTIRDPVQCRMQQLAAPPLDPLRNLPGICDAATLRRSIVAEVTNGLEAFRHTSTLDDQIEPGRVDSLFRLGQFLVYLKWTDIHRSLEDALRTRESVNPR
jgi:hypothetical protein